jgi:hypothetical protein
MNCKQGDLAMVVRRIFSKTDDMIGRIVYCKEYIKIDNVDAWLIEPFIYKGHEVLAFADAVLKPLRGDPVPEVDTKEVENESTIPA